MRVSDLQRCAIPGATCGLIPRRFTTTRIITAFSGHAGSMTRGTRLGPYESAAQMAGAGDTQQN